MTRRALRGSVSTRPGLPLRAAVATLAVVLLAACGQKGPLFLPGESKPRRPAATVAPPVPIPAAAGQPSPPASSVSP